MFYHISRTLEFLPYMAYAILGLVWVFMEVKCFRELQREKPGETAWREGFIPPPGEGYEYYVNANSICYIQQKAKNRFKIYIVQGDRPAAKLKQDKYGTYFNASCQDAAAAEKIVDVAFGM